MRSYTNVLRSHWFWSGVFFSIYVFLIIIFERKIFSINFQSEYLSFLPDSSVYYQHYLNYALDLYWNDGQRRSFFTLAFNKFPILILDLFNGNVEYAVIFSGAVGLLSFALFLNTVKDPMFKRVYAGLVLIIPYFMAGFVAIGKEVFIGSAVLLFLAYLNSGLYRYLFLSIFLAVFGRMLFIPIILFLWLFYRVPRYRSALLFVLAIITILTPIIGISSPGAPALNFADGAGSLSVLFATLVDYGFYPIIYPFKYVYVLISQVYNFELGRSFFYDTKIYMRLLSSLWMIFSVIFVLVNWRLWWGDYVARTVFYCFLLAPFIILFFDFNKVRYIYFVQFFLNYILAYSFVVYFKNRNRMV